MGRFEESVCMCLTVLTELNKKFVWWWWGAFSTELPSMSSSDLMLLALSRVSSTVSEPDTQCN